MEQRYRQLAWRMSAASLLVALVPLYLLGAGVYFYFQSVQRAACRSELRNLATTTSNAIQIFLAERTATLEALAHAASAEQLARPGELRKLLRLLNRRRTSFLDLGVIDAQGDHIAYVGPYELQDLNYADAEWFDETMLDGVFISDVFLGHRGVPHFVIAVKNELGERPWILRATIDPDGLLALRPQRPARNDGGRLPRSAAGAGSRRPPASARPSWRKLRSTWPRFRQGSAYARPSAPTGPRC